MRITAPVIICPSNLSSYTPFRERKLRWKAIAPLKGYGMREGCLDSTHPASVMQKLMELEEEGVETEYIPEGARVRAIEEIFHPEERWSTIKYI